jgi:hypothetical protein
MPDAADPAIHGIITFPQVTPRSSFLIRHAERGFF